MAVRSAEDTEKRRAAQRVRCRAYQASNREKINARRKAREERTPGLRETRLAYLRNYQAKNKKILAERVKPYSRKYYLEHRDEILRKTTAYQKDRPLEKIMDTHRKHRYGLTKEVFAEMLKKQNNLCLICGTENWNGRGPHVDHDHKTGKTRGILCFLCNSALGMVRDDPKIAKALLDYLLKNEQRGGELEF